MKIKALLIAATSLAATAVSQAFTIDFNALALPSGTSITSTTPQAINVTGYGLVLFEVPSPDEVQVGQIHANDSGTIKNSLEMDPGERIRVTFLGPKALNVDFDVTGVNPGFDQVNVTNIGDNPQKFQIDMIGNPGSNGAGLAAVSWTAVPEPSSALLGGLGAGLLILRRRR
ncbi:MAG: PEP-CTERM sorting domain-containing protein [Akkermansiaceae bacterium]